MKATRLFIGIKASRQLIRSIDEWRESQQYGFTKWIAPGNLHITLIPPWYETDVEKIKKILRQGNLGIKPFFVYFTNIVVGPELKNPRLIWIEGETSEKLVRLKENIDRLLNKKPEGRPFKTHITLLRFSRKEKNRKIKVNEEITWIEKINTITLFESKLLQSGAFYTDLLTIPLRMR